MARISISRGPLSAPAFQPAILYLSSGSIHMTAFIDARPMITALRTAPEDFRLSGTWLNHEPSQHNFQFDPDGHVSIQAACNCAMFAILPEQEGALRAAYLR